MSGACAVYVAGAAADFASTRVALTAPGAAEANPVQRSLAGQLGAQGAYVAVGCWADAKLQRSGKKGWARALRITFLVVKLGVAAHNLR